MEKSQKDLEKYLKRIHCYFLEVDLHTFLCSGIPINMQTFQNPQNIFLTAPNRGHTCSITDSENPKNSNLT